MKSNNDSLLADINITPFVDVLLVLLVLFIVTLPIVVQNLALNLPQGAVNSQPNLDKPIYIQINDKGVIKLADKKINFVELANSIKDLDKNSTIVIQADKTNTYGLIAEILTLIKSNGFEKVGLSIEKNKAK